jgi:hypothetical protein
MKTNFLAGLIAAVVGIMILLFIVLISKNSVVQVNSNVRNGIILAAIIITYRTLKPEKEKSKK